MNTKSKAINESLVKLKSAWLITWDWNGDHAKVEDKLVAILDYRRSARYIERLLEQMYVSSQLAYHEQLRYAKNRESSPYQVGHRVVEILKKRAERYGETTLAKASDIMMCGENPFLYARIVNDLEGYIDENNNEHLKWVEQQGNITEEIIKSQSC